MSNQGLMIVLSGPSGAGKGSIGKIIKQKLPSVKDSISVTTRLPRPGEIDGVSYYFKTVEQYQHMIASGEFLETAEVYCNFYGTPKSPVFDLLASGNDVLFDIDTIGAKQIKNSYPEAVTIFVIPPSLAVLKSRLVERKTETENALARRIAASKRELAEYGNYDYFVINDDLDTAAEQVISIIAAEKVKTYRQEERIKQMLGE